MPEDQRPPAPSTKVDPVEVTIVVPSAGVDFTRAPGDVVEMPRAEAARCLVMGFVEVDNATLRKALRAEGAEYRKLRAVESGTESA